MTCTRLRDKNQTSFSAVTPHFFRVVLDSTLRDNRLLIPKKFIWKYGETLSNPVFVKLPCGSEWKMGLTKFDGKVCLVEGWPEFSRHYSIDYGDFLVFRYEGNSRFHAFIFDTTTVEIDYPLIPSSFNEPQREESKDDDSVEIMEELSPCLRKRKSSPLPCFKRHKKLQNGPIGKTESNFSHGLKRANAQSNEVIPENSMSNRESQHSESEMIGKLHFPAEEADGDKYTMPRTRKCEVVKRKQQLTTKDEVKALHEASGLNSENLTCQIVMKPSRVLNHYDMSFPSHFSRNILKNRSCDATLKLCNGRTWPVKIRANISDQCKRARFQHKGWKKFAQDNNLKVGDVCNFELINGNKISFKVSILQAADISCSHPSYAGERVSNPSKLKDETAKQKIQGKSKLEQFTHLPKLSRGSGALEAASSFSSTNPFFKKTTEASQFKSCLQRVPVDFGKQYIEGKTLVELHVGRKSWSVVMLAYPHYAYMLSSGWSRFARENSVHPGDVCVYELIKAKNPMVFKVSIFRVNG